MNRWLSGLVLLGLTQSVALAQVGLKPGYMVIRVKLGATASSGAGGTGSFPGEGYGGSGGGSYPGEGEGYPSGGFGEGGGGPGYPGGPGGITGPGGIGGNNQPKPSDERSVVVIVPYEAMGQAVFYPSQPPSNSKNPKWTTIKTVYGNTKLFTDSNNVQLYPIRGATLETEIKQMHDRWLKSGRIDQLYDLTVTALNWDLIDVAQKYTKELIARVDALKDKDSAPSQVVKYLDAYKKIMDGLDNRLVMPSQAEEWKSRLGATNLDETTHYAIVHWGNQTLTADARTRREEALERNFKAFYLWHAIQGKALPFPKEKQLVVFANRGTDLSRLRVGLDGQPIVSDSFYSPVHNIVVISPERTDDLGRSFLQIAKAQYQDGWNRDELIAGTAPLVKGNTTFSEVARMMTYALVDRALEDESIRSAISREGCRQLYSSSGVLPEHVILPHWVENGLANMLFKPKDPGVVDIDGKPSLAVGLFAGYGSANYVLLREFRTQMTKKELNQDPVALLKNTILDEYFAAARKGEDIDPAPPAASDPNGGGFGPPGGSGGFAPPPGGGPGEGPGVPGSGRGASQGGENTQGPRQGPGGPGGPIAPGGPGGPGGPITPGGGGFGPGGQGPQQPAPESPFQKRMKLFKKAQTTSWALTYFLCQTRLEKLHEFYAELGKMPRDLRLDKQLVLITFCRTFNLMESNNSGQIDDAAFKAFAENWVNYMNAVRESWVKFAIEQADPNPGNGGGGPGGIPGGPGFPGGPGGPGGIPGGPGFPGGPGGGGR